MADNGSNSGNNKLTDIGNMNQNTLLYQIILDGLLFQEIKELFNNTYIGSNTSLNISRNFQELEEEHFYWKLNRQYYRCYYTSLPYRECITLLMNTKSQLSLTLNICSEVVDASILADMHTLNLRNCNNISDVSLLGGVYKLSLSGCKNLDNVSTLGQVHDLDLGGSNVVDVSALGGVYKLDLSYCRGVVNVSALGQVYELNLGGSNVVDVSDLGGVHTLNLSDC
jgi:hypothetical protein